MPFASKGPLQTALSAFRGRKMHRPSARLWAGPQAHPRTPTMETTTILSPMTTFTTTKTVGPTMVYENAIQSWTKLFA